MKLKQLRGVVEPNQLVWVFPHIGESDEQSFCGYMKDLYRTFFYCVHRNHEVLRMAADDVVHTGATPKDIYRGNDAILLVHLKEERKE